MYREHRRISDFQAPSNPMFLSWRGGCEKSHPLLSLVEANSDNSAWKILQSLWLMIFLAITICGYVTMLTGQVLIKEHLSSKFSLQKTETIPQKIPLRSHPLSRWITKKRVHALLFWITVLSENQYHSIKDDLDSNETNFLVWQLKVLTTDKAKYETETRFPQRNNWKY